MPRSILLGFALLAALGCSRTDPPPRVEAPEPPVVAPTDDIPPPRPVQPRTRGEALSAGVAYLLARQSEDGAWRSDVYATFKDGTALTPLAVVALQDAHNAGVRSAAIESAIRNGCAWLAKFARPDGTVEPPADGFDYPVYTASLTLKALSHPSASAFAKHRGAWVRYLKERQLTERLGWKPQEKQYGGWGYCRVIPKKPKPGEFAPPLIESNLSATLFALDALAAAKEWDEEAFKAAAVFVRRCQNYSLPPAGPLPPGFGLMFDGGFHFIYDDPVRNKAGMEVMSLLLPGFPHPRPVFHSYGSTTADGLRALRLCLLPEDEHREQSAAEWVVKHFRADTHPGTYVKTHEPNREAVYYYYAASVARAFRDHKLTLPNGRDWATELSTELAKRQARDGSWANPVEVVRENDPVVATSYAVSALARCK